MAELYRRRRDHRLLHRRPDSRAVCPVLREVQMECPALQAAWHLKEEQELRAWTRLRSRHLLLTLRTCPALRDSLAVESAEECRVLLGHTDPAAARWAAGCLLHLQATVVERPEVVVAVCQEHRPDRAEQCLRLEAKALREECPARLQDTTAALRLDNLMLEAVVHPSTKAQSTVEPQPATPLVRGRLRSTPT